MPLKRESESRGGMQVRPRDMEFHIDGVKTPFLQVDVAVPR